MPSLLRVSLWCIHEWMLNVRPLRFELYVSVQAQKSGRSDWFARLAALWRKGCGWKKKKKKCGFSSNGSTEETQEDIPVIFVVVECSGWIRSTRLQPRHYIPSTGIISCLCVITWGWYQHRNFSSSVLFTVAPLANVSMSICCTSSY